MKSNSFKIFISGYDINYDNYNEIVSLLNLAFKNKIKTHDIELLIYDTNNGRILKRYTNDNIEDFIINQNLYDEVCSIMRREESW